MLVWKKWSKYNWKTKTINEYKMLLLFGIIPLFVLIDMKK